jgi:hypothetical protein
MKPEFQKLKNIIKEQVQQELKSQKNFDWRKYYPEELKNNLEIEGDSVILYHFGDDGGTGMLDPKHFAKKGYTSDTRQWDKKRIFFYVHEKDREWRVEGKLFIVKYPLNKLYPFTADISIFNFYEECFGENDSSINLQLSCISKKAEAAGFDGFVLPWQDTYRVDVWVPVVVGEPSKDSETKPFFW